MSAATYADTGIEANRRRLTLDEASRGELPARFTAREWEAIHRASATYDHVRYVPA